MRPLSSFEFSEIIGNGAREIPEMAAHFDGAWLSNRRAQAVVADLVARGLVKDQVSGAGIGESRPIASNADESGRSLNRRVEVRCK